MYGSGILILLLLNFGAAEASGEVCYILDGILVVYGIVLTILYCRLRINSGKKETTDESKGEGIYQGLQHGNQDTYETLKMKKQPLS
ncbi:Fc receptor, IgE, high affinity I, gamma polypeptide like [Clarias gariepinus]|uniref:Fc receptor, IgE, high affinity I, gamma polypeptide like n=1 Tax=Clarias gariepinus TaxID=13013 RepID=UPI00234C2E1F|nr:Fc receptor, IgE, high affinity I, gamma polypeptide like [Clarias gariepinus]